ncbi:MAG: DinB family protein [Gemmatimonadota bacterium]
MRARTARIGVVVCVCVTALPGRASPQEGAALDVASIRAMLRKGLDTHRQMDIAFVRAIPDSALRWAPTPGVRDFAQQIEHIVIDNVLIASGGQMPSYGNPEDYLNDKGALEAVVETTYAQVVETLNGLSDAQLLEDGELFGNPMPRWRFFLVALNHADWTRGQLVPYYRLNGAEPPEWHFF